MIELAGIIVLGIFAQWLSWRTKVPAILPLIIIGLIVGPISSMYTGDGSKWIEPIFNEATGTGLFPGQSLFYFVSLAIGIILFEGGLTLRMREIKGVGPAILKLITLGSLITFLGAGLAAHFVMGLNWPISFLFAGLVIVTGPTVIAPILQNVPLNRNVATVLKWEGILIDPIGALVAVLVFEFIISGEGGAAFGAQAFKSFFIIILIGIALGTLAALALRQLIVSKLVPHYLLNVFTLAMVLMVFVLSDILAHESGLLTVVVMGMVMGNLNVPGIKEILDFKESLSVLLISILFILLAANINMEDLRLLLQWNCLLLFAIIVLILRPIGVFLSTDGSDLNFNEKIFVSWVGPRGIVAAGIASLFGLKLMNGGIEQAQYITPLVFMVVLGTVLLNATTARFMARLLGVIQAASDGILFVGSNYASRMIAKYLQESGRHVVLVDNNEGSVEKAQAMGLTAFQGNIYSDELNDGFELIDIGYLVAMTSNTDVNQYAVERFKNLYGENGTFRLTAPEEMKLGPEELPSVGLFSPSADYINLMEVARDYPNINELELESQQQFEDLMRNINRLSRSIPILLKKQAGRIQIIPVKYQEMEIEPGDKLIYLGQEIGAEVLE